jgi:hypothetical protein
MLADMRYALLLLGCLTAFLLPTPYGAEGTQGRLIALIDEFAWRGMVVLVLAAALVVFAVPRVTMALFAMAGLAGLLFGVGRLDLVLAGSGLWAFLLAGLTWFTIRVEQWRRSRGSRSVRPLLELA